MLSVIVPALNSASTIGPCLASVAEADERIVADGGSTDATVDAAAAAGANIVPAPRGRGPQLRAGADAANGDWLLFLHSDTRLSSGWARAADDHRRLRPAAAACFRFRLESGAWQARAVERGVALRTRLLNLPYGDQGLLVPRPLYEAVGGYAPLPLMEDVDLVRRLGRVHLLRADAVTSAERWQRDGWLSRSARNLACLGLWRAGMSAERITRFYG